MLAFLVVSAFGASAADPDPLLDALVTELDRTVDAWRDQPDAPYYVRYRVDDGTYVNVSAVDGALASSDQSRVRLLDASARVGTPDLDNTHPIRGSSFDAAGREGLAQTLPVDGSPLALRTAIWNATSDAVREAQERIVRVRANRTVKVQEEDASADFTLRDAIVDLRPQAAASVDRAAWEALLVDLSAAVNREPSVERTTASLAVVAADRYIVTTEGTRIREPHVWARVSLTASTTATDGSDISLYRWVDVHDPARLPTADELRAWAVPMGRDLVALRDAPKGEPWSGPVLLRGRAAGVFVHEVLGHRVEGHRQKRENEGQTFKDLIGKPILPSFVSVADDPTVAQVGGVDLNGHYAYDEEGSPAARAVLVENGVFRGFLMSRSPIAGFPGSNGHGRAQAGMAPVSRMANTILETRVATPAAELRARLLAEVRRQKLPYGIVVDELAGGFTLTGRVAPNAFNIRATTAWRVYADGRPDELVRGIDLVGTPIAALGNLVATGDDPGVFDGFCGAESGSVPNAAVSPSLLLRTLEVQRKEKSSDRPPILPRPGGRGES
jgi:TldD protein